MSSTGPNGAGDAANATRESSGVTPPAIALPKGGGAIRGIGEKFAVNPVTGTSSLVVPLVTSPGRSGFGPELSIQYDSGAGNGCFGFGWHLELPSITRKTDKGLPRYDDTANSDVFILSGAEDLVPVLKANAAGEWVLDQNGVPTIQEDSFDGYSVRRYRPRVEGLFARIERWTRTDDPKDVHWRSITTDNVLTLYGVDSNSRIEDPAPNSSRIFSWLICETRDDKGNGIIYRYKADDGVGVNVSLSSEFNRGKAGDPGRTANRYLKHIFYGNRASLLDSAGDRPRSIDPALISDEVSQGLWMFEVVFDYGEHSADSPSPEDAGEWYFRLDPFSTRRSGFEVRTTRLCQRVLMFHHFENEIAVGRECLVRSIDFTYSVPQTPAQDGGPAYSFLRSTTQCGYRREPSGYLKRSMPKVEFEYTQPLVQQEVSSIEADSFRNLPEGIDGSRYRWVDLHGEGISGILSEQTGSWWYHRNLSPLADGGVQFAPMERIALQPDIELGNGKAEFMDLAGDGIPDLVVMNDAVPGFYEHDDAESWETFRPFVARINRNFDDPNLRLIDLDGDGRADILITEGDALIWHPSLGEDGFGAACRVDIDLDEERAPRLVFADPSAAIHLADMTGDGLTDLVRITRSEVCYWPNLGNGNFGPKITMDNAPNLGSDGTFDPARILLADIDGSGTADLIHLHSFGIRLYFNLSGNAWSLRHPLDFSLRVDDAVYVRALDLFGNGTACLVWSSPLPGERFAPLRYIDLMGNDKPHLMSRVVNNLGAETRIGYASSSKFYLSDKRDGKPWVTRLPFPVHVVEKVETFDAVSRSRFVTRHAYHHGYFDGEEREFRGFGMVEQWDTESFAVLSATGDLPQGDNVAADSHVPPVHTKTWFHTGAYLGQDRIDPSLAGLLDLNDWRDYFKEPGLSPAEAEASMLTNQELPTGLATGEAREAYRALKGTMLRQEVFAADGSDKENFPYLVTMGNQAVRLLQPRGGNEHAVFMTHALETVSFHYERNPADPRISHSLTLEVDAFGNVLKQADVAYGRRAQIRVVNDDGAVNQIANPGLNGLAAWDVERQTRSLLTYSETRATTGIDERDHYRAPASCETCTFELTGYSATGPAGRFVAPDIVESDPSAPGKLRHRFTEEIPYEASSDLPMRRRPIARQRILWRSDDFRNLLPLGELSRRGLAGATYSLVFTPGLLDSVFKRRREGLPPEPLLPDIPGTLSGAGGRNGGYISNDILRSVGLFPNDGLGDHWWLPSGRVFLSPNIADDPAAEFTHAREHFFLPHRFVDPFGQTTHVSYDSDAALPRNHNLLPTTYRDSVGNITRAVNDYRVLQAFSVRDPNGNGAEVSFDALGLVVGTVMMGKTSPAIREGDSFTDFTVDPDPDAIRAFFDSPDPHLLAPIHLGTATTRVLYDLNQVPACVATIARETHVANLGAGEVSRSQLSFGYSDGLGRAIGQKLQAEPGPTPRRDANGKVIVGPDGLPEMAAAIVSPRWVGNGWTIFNNKGGAVRQYQPFFTDTHRFEPDLRIGTSPIVFYDPMQRIVGAINPDHTWEKIAFDPWQQVMHDASDTLLTFAGGTGPVHDLNIGGYFARLPQGEYLPGWHQLRTDPAFAAELALRYPDAADRANQAIAATNAVLHAGTPTRILLDAVGRPFLTFADNGPDPANPDGEHRLLALRVELDIQGNQRTIRDSVTVTRDAAGVETVDPLGRLVAQCDYNMLGQRLYQANMESGERWALCDVGGNPIRSWDGRGHAKTMEYDARRRPLRTYVAGLDAADPDRKMLVERFVYGEQHPEWETRNLRGKLYLRLDQAGAVANEAYDFKGSPARSTRRVTAAADYRQDVDWRAVDEDPVALPSAAGQQFDMAAFEAALNARLAPETYESRVLARISHTIFA